MRAPHAGCSLAISRRAATAYIYVMAEWRRMMAADLEAVRAIADRVHEAYPEDTAVFVERLTLYPDGCYVLDAAGDVVGYLIGHPWHDRNPPKLNARLGAIPERPTTYYIHDVAILPDHRKARKAWEIVTASIARAQAAGFASVSLVAVSGSAPFWKRFDFQRVDAPDVAAELASYDGDACLMVRALVA